MKRDSKLSQDSFLGIILLVSIVDLPPNYTDVAIVVEYRHHAYDIVNERLGNIASRISSVLQKEG